MNQNEGIDTNLYSRQLCLYGFETMKKIMKLNIFIYGIKGLGVEIIKNIVLAGPNKVTIYDPNISKINEHQIFIYQKRMWNREKEEMKQL